MRKWTALLVLLLVVALTAPAVAKPGKGKPPPKDDVKESCWDIRYNHGATAWNLAEGVTRETPWPYDITYPVSAEGPACFDLPEVAGSYEVSWEITEGKGEILGIYLSFRSEIYGTTECTDFETREPATTQSATLIVPDSCVSSIADGYVLMAMIDRQVKGQKTEPLAGVTFTVIGPTG